MHEYLKIYAASGGKNSRCGIKHLSQGYHAPKLQRASFLPPRTYILLPIKLSMKSNKPTPKGLTRDLGLQLPFTSYMNWSDHHTSPDMFTKISWFLTRPMDPFDNLVKVKDAFSE